MEKGARGAKEETEDFQVIINYFLLKILNSEKSLENVLEEKISFRSFFINFFNIRQFGKGVLQRRIRMTNFKLKTGQVWHALMDLDETWPGDIRLIGGQSKVIDFEKF
jgi:hypothetical protein